MGFTKMKKTLAALAVLGAFAGTAAAADVTLYGDIDTGFAFTHEKVESMARDADGDLFPFDKNTGDVNSFQMVNGINSASKFGLKGVEDLGNGFKVGFKLENGFEADDGTFSMANRLFGREASLSVYSNFGTLTLGRVGSLGAATGSYDVIYSVADAFDGGDEYAFGFTQAAGRLDNSITYQTPEFAGLQATAQYSLKNDNTGDGVEGESTADRYFGVALNGTYGPAQFVLAYELTKYSTLDRDPSYKADDLQVVSLGGNYDFGVAKIFAMGQYFRGADTFAGDDDFAFGFGFDPLYSSEKGWEGYSLHVGTVAPIAAGELTVGLYYSGAKIKDVDPMWGDYTAEDIEAAYYGIGARYTYPLSKRTTVYFGGSYAETKLDNVKCANETTKFETNDAKKLIGAAYVGIAHHF